jgi:hypothetical protein
METKVFLRWKHLLDNLQKPVVPEGEPERVPNVFPPIAKWRELKHKNAPVEEPMWPSHMRWPNVPEGEEECHQFDFDETFDRPPFTAMSEVYEIDHKGKRIKTRQGKAKTVQQIHKDGRPDSDLLKKHKLS